jgi:pimeloyl-ACP methyl ester carboxylesterase
MQPPFSRWSCDSVWEEIMPRGVQNGLVNIGPLRLNVFDWGSVDKPPLFLLHGLASSSHMFDLIAPPLVADYHVIAYDQRGHGLSDKPHSGYDFENIAVDLDKLIAALGFGDMPFALAGHSWGASTVLYYAASRPAPVQKTILMDGGLRPVRDVFSTLADMAPPQYHNRTLAEVKRMIREDWLGAAWRPELEPLVLSIYDLSNPDDVQPHLELANHMQIAQALWDFSAADYYPHVQCPLLVINAVKAGESPDPRLQAYAAEAQKRSRNCECVWMLNTIHDIPWQRPKELADIMRRFLAGESASA